MKSKIPPVNRLGILSAIGLVVGLALAVDWLMDPVSGEIRELFAGVVIFVISFIILEHLYLRSLSTNKPTTDMKVQSSTDTNSEER